MTELEELFHSCYHPSVSPDDAPWCARATIKAMCKKDLNNRYAYTEIKAYVEKRYGLI